VLPVSLSLVVTAWAAPASAVSEERMMAGFLFNFAKFVKWPEAAFASPEAPISIGVLGDRDFAEILTKVVSGKTARGRAIEVEVHQVPGSAREGHILFAPASWNGGLDDMVSAVTGFNVLTVADAPGFSQAGGMVTFLREGSKLRFEINEVVAGQAGLRISARLLGLARVVR
jgi:hypothetical protein